VTKTASRFVGQSLPSRVLYVVIRSLVVAFTRLWTRTEVRGREHLPAGGFILAPVHRSNMDTPIAATITRRRLRYMGKESLWVNPVTGWLFSALGAFPVSRGTVDLEATKRCLVVLRGSEPLVVFPEGERKSGPKVQPLFDGAAYLALKSGAPIVPVGIGGSERVMPKGARIIYPRKVVVIVGEPLLPGLDTGGRVRRERVDEVTGELHARIQELFDEAEAAAAS
jgi:1-acyl-sn-glycerol-3-phosphate acyltransferase